MAQNSSEEISVPLKKTLLAPLPLWCPFRHSHQVNQPTFDG